MFVAVATISSSGEGVTTTRTQKRVGMGRLPVVPLVADDDSSSSLSTIYYLFAAGNARK